MQTKKRKNFWLSILITANGVLHCNIQADTALAVKTNLDVRQACTVSNIALIETELNKDNRCKQYQYKIAASKKNTGNRQPSSQKIFSPKNFLDKQTIVKKTKILDRPLDWKERLKSKYQMITASVVDVNPQLIASSSPSFYLLSQTSESPPTSPTESPIQSEQNPTQNESPPQSPTDSPVPSEQNPTQPEENSQPVDPPPVEGEPANIDNNPSPTEIEKQLDATESEATKKFERLLEILEENKQPVVNSTNERETQLTSNTEIDTELGELRVIEKPLEQLPIPQQSVAKFKPIGSLIGRIGYFQTSNIFSAQIDPQADGLFYSGLTLSSVPLRLGGQTYLRGSIDGNIFRYVNQSDFDYNQLRFNLGILQRLGSKMYAELGWRNQQLFYARDSDRFNIASGDKFLNENAFRLSLGRRDPLSKKLMLDSFYELRLSLTDIPAKRDRIINYLSIFLNYYLEKPLQVGFGYQFNYSDFTERIREDQYHRLLANLNYKMSDYSNLSLQTGVSLGSSTQENIDFDGWFFSINYNFDLGKF